MRLDPCGSALSLEVDRLHAAGVPRRLAQRRAHAGRGDVGDLRGLEPRRRAGAGRGELCFEQLDGGGVGGVGEGAGEAAATFWSTSVFKTNKVLKVEPFKANERT